MDDRHRESADGIRSQLQRGLHDRTELRAALLAVPFLERDAWLDRALGLDAVPDDGPELPRDCVAYLPCPVDAVLRLVDGARVGAADVFIDVGAGAGRTAALVHLLTGASVVGLEIQPHLVHAARDLAARLQLARLSFVDGDATKLAGLLTIGSVFFLYCPFSGKRLARVLDDLEPIARSRPIRVCSVNLPLPPCPWLTLEAALAEDVTVYRGTLFDERFGLGSATPEDRGCPRGSG